MKIKDFFSFSANTNLSTFQASPIVLEENKTNRDDCIDLIKGKYDEIDFPVVFKQFHGKKLLDILSTGWPSRYLISDKMKTVLENNKLTGWKTFPIKLYDKKGNEILGYHGFSVTGRCGPIDYKKAEIIDKQMIPTGPIFKAYKGLYIGLETWDCTDFFIPGESIWFIITEKAANVLKKDKSLNIELINCCDFERDVDSVLNKG